MPIPVKLFASLRSRFGQEISLDLNPPISVERIAAALREQGSWTQGARIAVNFSFANDKDTVAHGDEVAVIPPVSGG